MNSTFQRIFIFFCLFLVQLFFRYFFIHYLTSSYCEFYYYSFYKSSYLGNCTSVLNVVNFYLFNDSSCLPLVCSDLNFYLLYCTENKCVFKIFPTLSTQLSFFNYYYSNVFFDLIPIFNDQKDNILFRDDVIALLKAHPLFSTADYLFVNDISMLSHVQLVRRISIYNYMIGCYEKYLISSGQSPGNLTDEIISVIFQDYCRYSWFKVKLLRLLKFT